MKLAEVVGGFLVVGVLMSFLWFMGEAFKKERHIQDVKQIHMEKE